MGYKTKGELDKETLKYQTNIPTNAISLDEGETLISKTIAVDLMKGIETVIDKTKGIVIKGKAEEEAKETDKPSDPKRYKKNLIKNRKYTFIKDCQSKQRCSNGA